MLRTCTYAISSLSEENRDRERGEKRKSSRKKTSSINFELEVRKTKFPRRRTREFLFLPCLIKEEGEDTREIYFSNKPGWKSSERTLLHARGKHTRELGFNTHPCHWPVGMASRAAAMGMFFFALRSGKSFGGRVGGAAGEQLAGCARLLRACPRHWLSKTKVRKCLTSSVVGSVGSVDRSVGSIRFDSIRFGSVRHTAPHRYCRDEFCTSEYITPNVCRPIMTILFHLIRPRPLVLFPLLFLSTLRSTFVPRSISLFLLLLVVCSSTAFRFVALSLSLSLSPPHSLPFGGAFRVRDVGQTRDRWTGIDGGSR